MKKSKLLSFIVLSVVAGVHSYAQSRVRGLTSAEMEEAKNAIVQSHPADLKEFAFSYIEPQSFHVTTDDADFINVVSIEYVARDENFNGLRRRCAVAIQDQQGKVELVHSIGYNAYEIVGCRATKAVGVMDVDGQKSPRLLFLYAGSYTPTESGVFPVVLEWDVGAGRYVLNQKISSHLENAHGTDTIAGMKRALRAYDEAHKRKNR